MQNNDSMSSNLTLFSVLYTVGFLSLVIVMVFSMIKISYSQTVAANLTQRNLISNPNFDQSGSGNNATIGSWNVMSCKTTLRCVVNSTTGWNDNRSFQITTNATSQTQPWSIKGKPINVTPGQKYQFVSHMKLNQYATKSHVAIDAYNQTSNKWYQIMRCPTGTKGPSEWHGYSCEITIPAATMKIRPVLYPGWSTQPGKQAVTLFDAFSLKATKGPSKVPEATAANNHTGIGGFIP